MSKSKITLTPDQISDKWNRRLKGSVSDIQTGIENVTESPTEAAAAKSEKMLANLTEAVQNGKWQAGLKKVSLEEWKSTTKKKVAERLSSGVDAAMTKRQAFDAHNVSVINQILPKIKSMPDMTLSDSVERVRTFMEHMNKNRYKK